MAGRIVSLAATVGAPVRKGETLLALEAMKMEHPSLAPMAATVKAVHVQVGAQVAAGMLLIELEPAA
jgi:biotin carboxyl carrier protein